MYPKNKVNDPSSFGHHPSNAGVTVCPREYEYRVCALDLPSNRSIATAARITQACPERAKRVEGNLIGLPSR
jgi:hypothetical protein